ncbi:GyrI-like domain-containing protein [Guptibacillus algicola]|uniref:GyrI-like domain-containing protein n=1 Tax=Guptibacillus algicola TaxID=225844 RepID=UPI001CD303AF|nr:GyrI-like domain-containing protein [Alkalihalobacillus algicola]MCA0988614.1 GyrI-like domain-containing protein [Alkalihalobacillus algicola]
MSTELQTPVLVEMGEMTLIGMKCDTTMKEKDKKIPEMVESFYANHVDKIQSRIDPNVSFGIYVDPPNWDPDTEEFSWIACVEVEEDAKVPEGMTKIVLPPRRYAAVQHDPTSDECNPYSYLHRWVQESSYERTGDLYGFEKYTPFIGTESKYLLHLPIK